MNLYLTFYFDLGYGEPLTVISNVTEEEMNKVKILKEKVFSEEEYISFDENYLSLNHVLESINFFSLEVEIPTSNYPIVDKLLEFAEDPSEEEYFKSSVEIKRNNKGFEEHLQYAKLLAEKEKQGVDSDQLFSLLNADRRFFSNLDDIVSSLELFGICEECGSPLQENGCPTCNLWS